MTAGAGGSVTIDLQAAQSPHYRGRGIARYASDFTEAVVDLRPELIRQVLLNPRFPAIDRLDRLVGRVPVRHEPDWPVGGGIFHVMSPFELDVPIGEIWPREASRSGAQLVVTVYDAIPEVFPDVYLEDPGLRRRYRARRELVRAADHVLAISDSSAADAVRLFGIPEQRVTCVGASTSSSFRFPQDRMAAAARAREVIPGLVDPYIVYNGAVEPRKNMEALVEAFAGAGDEIRSGWQLVLVCGLRPSERNHFEVRARELGIDGRLVLTGFVPDATLEVLYQGCDLMVFPSLYEGFGLPIAEALACGAPVIASNTSSMPELVAPGATFDPASVGDISVAINRALTDARWREELLAWTAKPRPGWDEVAARSVDVYERLLALPSGTRRWRRRPRVAMVTPWPPQRTGVADYSKRLVEAMAVDIDVDLFLDGDAADEPAGQAYNTAAQLLDGDRAIGGYDAVLLSLGNSEFHAGALKLLRENPGRFDVLAHDVRLAYLYVHGLSRGAVPEGFEAAARRTYPSIPDATRFEGNLLHVADEAGLYFAREVVALARRVLTTSEFAASVARLDAHPHDASRVEVWPYAYPQAVERDPRLREEGLVCTFGVIHHLKAPDLLLRAVHLLAARGTEIRLAFVGPVSVALREDIGSLAGELGIATRVEVTGDVPDDAYEDWLQRADVAVQLRKRSNGETSGAVADCLAHGIPAVVTDLGPQAELPEFVAKVPPGVRPDQLASVIAALLEAAKNPDLGERSLEFVRSNGFDRAARQLWQLLPELGTIASGRR